MFKLLTRYWHCTEWFRLPKIQPHSAFGNSNSILSTQLNILDTLSTRTDSKILRYSSVTGLASVLLLGFGSSHCRNLIEGKQKHGVPGARRTREKSFLYGAESGVNCVKPWDRASLDIFFVSKRESTFVCDILCKYFIIKDREELVVWLFYLISIWKQTKLSQRRTRRAT